jgi:hypothetical protein
MKRNDCDTDPESNAGEPVNDGFGGRPQSRAERLVDRLGEDYVPPPKGSWLQDEEASDGMDPGPQPGQPQG